MKLMTGIFDRPMTDDDDDERKRPKDGCPTPWKHCWTRHISWSWTRPRNLDGTARPLAVRCHASTTGVWGSPVVCRPRVFSSGPHFSTYSGPTRGSWAVPPQKPRTLVHRTQNSWLWSWSISPWTTRRCWPAWKGVVSSLQERGFRRNLPLPLDHWVSTPQPRPCVASSERWPWLEQPKPQAANLCTRDRVCLEYKVSALRSTHIAGSENGCRFSFGNENTRETWAGIQLKTTGHVIALPFCPRRYGLTKT